MNHRIFDCHSDLPKEVYNDRTSLGKYYKDMNNSNINTRVFSVYLDDKVVPEKSLHSALDIIEGTKINIKESNNFSLTTDSKDFEKNKINVILGLEGAEPLKNSLNLLDVFYDLGVRTITLTHSRRNMVAEGSVVDKSKSRNKGGLSNFGSKVINRMNDKDMVIDISHINREGFWDVIDEIDKEYSIIASHSNSYEICKHPRNLKDDQIKAISEVNGVIGACCGIKKYVGSENPDISDFLEHINKLVDLTSTKNVGIGCDYMYYLSKYDKNIEGVNGLETDKELVKLPSKLRENYNKKEVEDICYNNFRRLFGNTI